LARYAPDKIAWRKPAYTCRKRGPPPFESGMASCIESGTLKIPRLSTIFRGTAQNTGRWRPAPWKCADLDSCASLLGRRRPTSGGVKGRILIEKYPPTPDAIRRIPPLCFHGVTAISNDFGFRLEICLSGPSRLFFLPKSLSVCAHMYASTASFAVAARNREGVLHGFGGDTIVRMGDYEMGLYGCASGVRESRR